MEKSISSLLSDALINTILPGIDVPLSSVGKIQHCEIKKKSVLIKIELGIPLKKSLSEIKITLIAATATIIPDAKIELAITSNIIAHAVKPPLSPIKNVRNIIAIASGKGGVGKSTIATNMALALVQEGAKVGMLDADIYGPSQPLMFGLEGERPQSTDGKNMYPLIGHGVQVISIGLLVDTNQPLVWRGPMVSSALNQLLNQTKWDDLDYLIVDMPPGTGDIQLTLSQKIPVSGVAIITTPQDIALLDARRGLEMFKKVSVPILGVIENMSTYVCQKCQHEEPIFGSQGGVKMADELNVQLLGQLPLDISIRKQTDGGFPTVINEPDGSHANIFRKIALRMVSNLATQSKDFSQHFKKIVVEKNS